MSGSDTAEIVLAELGSLGRITLNRPKAINALTHGMIRAIDAALNAWKKNAAIKIILIDGAGERGFCAGGDIRALYEGSKSGDFAAGDLFFRDEYRLNACIATFPKPVVAFMDGIVMGGGIGFIPDVGGTYLLARAPGNLGIHAALTAGKLSAADAILSGLADICVAVEALPEIAGSLVDCQDAQAIDALLQHHKTTIAPAPLGAARSWIDAAYARSTVELILAALQERAEPEAQSARQDLAGKSPTSLKVALRLLLSARAGSDLKTCLQREYDAALTCIRSLDFVEGVRAAVVDKDRKPRWSPATLAEVTPEAVDHYFRTSPETALF